MPAELEIARQWVAKAKNDLLNADNNLRAADVPSDTVCFAYWLSGEMSELALETRCSCGEFGKGKRNLGED